MPVTTAAVSASIRSGKFNKNAARRVRVSGLIPAVLYGAGQESVAITLDPKTILKILHSETGHNTIFDLDVAESAGTKAMIVDWQYEPIKGKLLHIDLKRIAMDKAMRVSVPVFLTGTSPGVKLQGGVLDQVLREVQIECLPGDIPASLDVDISNLNLGDAIHIADLPHSGSIKFLEDGTSTVAHVTMMKEDAAVDAAAPGTPEPEVTKGKGKPEAAAATPAKGAAVKTAAAKVPAAKK